MEYDKCGAVGREMSEKGGVTSFRSWENRIWKFVKHTQDILNESRNVWYL